MLFMHLLPCLSVEGVSVYSHLHSGVFVERFEKGFVKIWHSKDIIFFGLFDISE